MQFHIKNQQGLLIGVADVETSSGGLMQGRFAPSPEFERYAAVFGEQEQEQEQAAGDAEGLGHGMHGLRHGVHGLGLYAAGPLPMPGSTAIEAIRIHADRIVFRLAPPAPGASA